VLVWDNDRRHLSRVMRTMIEARQWLTVFQLPSYAPELNPAEGVWSALKRMQYRPGLLDDFIAQTGFILEPP
jgi:putative transposase